MAYYIAFLLFTTISHGFYPRDWDWGQRLTNEQRVKFAEGCSWYGRAPFCPSGNSCPSNMLRLDCKSEETLAIQATSAYYDFGYPCSWGTKSYCCPSCQWVSGDGNGSDETKIGEFTGKECVDKCMAAGGYNGATIKADGSAGCWCEKGMTGVTASSTYKTCLFMPAFVSAESEVASLEADNRKLQAANDELRTLLRSLAN